MTAFHLRFSICLVFVISLCVIILATLWSRLTTFLCFYFRFCYCGAKGKLPQRSPAVTESSNRTERFIISEAIMSHSWPVYRSIKWHLQTNGKLMDRSYPQPVVSLNTLQVIVHILMMFPLGNIWPIRALHRWLRIGMLLECSSEKHNDRKIESKNQDQISASLTNTMSNYTLLANYSICVH